MRRERKMTDKEMEDLFSTNVDIGTLDYTDKAKLLDLVKRKKELERREKTKRYMGHNLNYKMRLIIDCLNLGFQLVEKDSQYKINPLKLRDWRC